MKKTIVNLSREEIEELRSFKSSAKRSQREYNRANILLLLPKEKTDAEIEDFLEVERTTIWRTKKKFLKEELLSALGEKPRSGQPKKYGPTQESEIVALALAIPLRKAQGGRWSLWEDTLEKKEALETLNRET